MTRSWAARIDTRHLNLLTNAEFDGDPLPEDVRPYVPVWRVLSGVGETHRRVATASWWRT
ncbi:hypothetical protein GCM10023195_86640 [Actinoallomurus liliacearum]|uniref:Uncharacterized protein n=1 Tax=Actinoallomurus liliacearum TaxID=1080073 RepID=A0ABP8U237_9ACTN